MFSVDYNANERGMSMRSSTMTFWPDICECVATLGTDFVLGYEGGRGWYITRRDFLNQNWDISDEGWQGFYEELESIEDPILMRKGLMQW